MVASKEQFHHGRGFGETGGGSVDEAGGRQPAGGIEAGVSDSGAGSGQLLGVEFVEHAGHHIGCSWLVGS
ncbi:hypothetical protein, partial [Mycobacterium timonense]